jgi:Fe-S oxidoreductase
LVAWKTGRKPLLCWKRNEREVTIRIALFITCFNDTLFPEVGQAMVQVLERLGQTVDFPLAQTCCGQMQSVAPNQYHLALR